jgi:uncharacterized membrane protein
VAKVTRYTKGQQVSTNSEGHASFEQHEIYDDYILPSAEELAKLKEVEPAIVQWILNKAETEQSCNHNVVRTQLSLLEAGLASGHRIDTLTILTASLQILTGMIGSFYLLLNEHTVAGSIFGGVTTVIITRAFLNFKGRS